MTAGPVVVTVDELRPGDLAAFGCPVDEPPPPVDRFVPVTARRRLPRGWSADEVEVANAAASPRYRIFPKSTAVWVIRTGHSSTGDQQ